MNAISDIVAESGHDMPQAIAEAIGAVMGKVQNVEKRGENKFHNYKFARVEDLIFQVQPAMVEAGLVITQDEIGHEMAADAVMLATYAFSLSHKSGVTWGPIRQTGMASLKNTKGGYDDKALNKCHTAARKYFILGLFQVPAGDLPDADSEEERPAANSGHKSPVEPPKPPTLSERADRLEATLKAVKTAAELNKAYGLAQGLLKELDAKDPERGAEIETLYRARTDELTPQVAA